MSSVFASDCLKGRVTLVTGGGSGIGFGIAKQLGKHGSRLVLMGRRKDFLENAAEVLRKLSISVEVYAGDVRSETDAENVVEFALKKFGKLDSLVNCAAGNFLSLAEDLTVKGFKTVLDIDLVGTYNMSRACFPALRNSGDGSIINISTTFHYTSGWYQTHAAAAKSAIDTLTRQFALEWGTYKIRVNGIAPGAIADTPGYSKLAPLEASRKLVYERIPLSRLGAIEEIGDSAVFLQSKAANYITGHTLVVDGGAWFYTPPPVSREQVKEASKQVEAKSRSVGKAKL